MDGISFRATILYSLIQFLHIVGRFTARSFAHSLFGTVAGRGRRKRIHFVVNHPSDKKCVRCCCGVEAKRLLTSVRHSSDLSSSWIRN